MKDLRGSKTELNLLKAFAGESQARNRYTYFAAAAKKEGYVQISAIFEETANQEKEHAKRFFKFLDRDEMIEITASYPAGKIGCTLDNLIASANGELHEYSHLYPEFAKTAREEGFEEVAAAFANISVSERHHEARFRALADNIDKGRVFRREKKITWRCRNCGYTHEGDEAPEKCPACLHPRDHFEAYHCDNL